MFSAVPAGLSSRRHPRARRALTRIAFVAGALALVGASSVVSPNVPAARALDAGLFNPGNIISDSTFFNSSTMSAGDIQSFLNAKVPQCNAAGWPCLKDYRMGTSTKPATEFCSHYEGRGNESAAEIIHRVSVACGINPQVILVTLQKERSLVLKKTPTEGDYKISMGYACPDDAPCDQEFYGFFNQIYYAAYQFQRYTKYPARWGYQAGRYNYIQYAPNASCGGTNVFIENQATANLYIYTPYQPNSASLGNLHGLGDGCSSYGNRNFWVFFNDWFGSPTGLQSGSFENGSAAGWTGGNGFINQAVYTNPAIARDGSGFIAFNTPVKGRSLAQDVPLSVGIGAQAALRLSLRSGSSVSVSGTVALWGIGGSQEVATLPFTVSDSWQDLALNLYPEASAHGSLKVEIYLDTINRDLYVDAVTLKTGPAALKQNLVKSPSFEGSMANWGSGNAHINQQVYNDPGIAQDGAWFAAVSTQTPGASFAQEISLGSRSTAKHTFRIYLRSTVPNFSGTVALWGFGNTTVSAAQPFQVGDSWTAIEVSLPAGNSLDRLKAEIYMDTTGAALWLDNAVVGADRLENPGFESGSYGKWHRSSDNVNQAIYRSSPENPAREGQYFAVTNIASDAGGSIYQDFDASLRSGGTYTARLWVRTGDDNPFEGTLALWALGGQTELALTPFTATNEWTPITLSLPIRNEDHTTLRFEMYEHTVGRSVYIDAAQLY